jgi:aryl-alcohol dehydrogenase-like predicted oxidoreductase
MEMSMRYRKLGHSGPLVSELCLGTNMFGGKGLEFWKELGEKATANVIFGSTKPEQVEVNPKATCTRLACNRTA